MNDRKHVPGPWEIKDVFGFTDIVGDKGRAKVCNVNGRAIKEQIATANLIAAAPELLEALERIADYAGRVSHDICDQDTGWFYQFGAATDKALTAIAKATGE